MICSKDLSRSDFCYDKKSYKKKILDNLIIKDFTLGD